MKNKIESESIKLAYLRWEIIRENKEYKNDFDKFIVKYPEQRNNPLIYENYEMLPHENLAAFSERVEGFILGRAFRFPRSSGDFSRKWRLRIPVDVEVNRPNPFSLGSLVDYPVSYIGNHCFSSYEIKKTAFGAAQLDPFDVTFNEQLLKHYKNKFKEPLSYDWHPWFVAHLYSSNKQKDFETTRMILEIDLKQDIKYIQSEIGKILSNEKKRLVDKGIIKTSRQNLKVMADAMKVYRLVKAGEKFPAIAKKIFPYDFKNPLTVKETDPDPNPDSAIVKVQQYYKKAKEMIRDGL
jgi:hypothetical protein